MGLKKNKEVCIYDSEMQENLHDRKKKSIWRGIFGTVIWLMILACMFLFIKTHIVVVPVQGASMMPTVYGTLDKSVTTYVLSWKPAKVERGDIVIILAEDGGTTKSLIKRVIGLPGETVTFEEYYNSELNATCVRTLINGEVLEETYIKEPMYSTGTWVTTTFEVGEDEVFVMGDNRNVSNDSRALGCLKMSNVQGEVFFTFNSTGWRTL